MLDELPETRMGVDDLPLTVTEPFKLTLLPWKIATRKRGTTTNRDGTRDASVRREKIFALSRPVDSYTYGTITRCEEPDHQVGQACSPESGLLVIDVDNAELFSTTNTAEALDAGQHVPFTRRGSDGNRHYWVDARRVPRDEWPRQGTIPGGDIKANGFVPIPGCVHPSGDRYEPMFGEGDDLPLIEMWPGDTLHRAILADQADAKELRSQTRSGSSNVTCAISGGNEPALFSYCGALVAAGYSKDDAWPLWLKYAQTLPLSEPDYPWTEDNYDIFDGHYDRCVSMHVGNNPGFEIIDSAPTTVVEIPRIENVDTPPQVVCPQPEVSEESGAHRVDVISTLSDADIIAMGRADYTAAYWLSQARGDILRWSASEQRWYTFTAESDEKMARRWVCNSRGAEQAHHEATGFSRDVDAMVDFWVNAKYRTLTSIGEDSNDGKKLKKDIENLNKSRACVSMRRARANLLTVLSEFPEQNVSLRDFDGDSSLLNFRNGTFDVRTGVLREHNPNDMITHLVDRDLNMDAIDTPLSESAPYFWKLLNRACGAPGEYPEHQHSEMVQAILRWFGYLLHGSNPEKKFAIMLGASDVGKTQLVEIVNELLGEGSLSWSGARSQLIVENKGNAERHDTVSSPLRGKRSVLINELGERQRLDEVRILELVNGEGTLVPLRLMSQEAVNVPITWKITVTSNDLPQAELPPQVVNRLNLYQLSTVSVPKHEQDQTLKARIVRDEGDAVLTYLVSQWRAWFLAREAQGGLGTGLIVPAAMRQSITSYREANRNLYELFLDEYCQITSDPSDEVTPSALWAACQKYLREQHPSQIKFWEKRNFFYKHVSEYPGVSVRHRYPDDPTSRREAFCGLKLSMGVEVVVWNQGR